MSQRVYKAYRRAKPTASHLSVIITPRQVVGLPDQITVPAAPWIARAIAIAQKGRTSMNKTNAPCMMTVEYLPAVTRFDIVYRVLINSVELLC